MINKVIIWGHKLHSHTHSYIHNGYYRAFKSMGYDTYWFDNSDDVSSFDFTNCLFFTEDQVQQKIPLVKDSIYILHHCNPTKYFDAGCRVINLCNYLKYCQDGVSFNYRERGNTVEKMGELFYFDKNATAIYQPWATDLLPEEINPNDIVPYRDCADVNYIGTQWEVRNELERFKLACQNIGKNFKLHGSVSDEENRRLIRESYVAPDIRNEWHKTCGYLPCRIFKNLSYGKLTGTNSPHVKEIFGELIPYNIDPYALFYECEREYKNLDIEKMKEVMRYIKDNHTYVNRINNIMRIVGIL